MNDILKTLVTNNSLKKWMEFSKLKTFFSNRDIYFDKIISFIEEYFNNYSLFPKYEQIQKHFISSSEDQLLTYLQGVYESQFPCYDADEDFVTALVVSQKALLEMDIVKTISDYQNEYTNLEVKNKDSIINSVDDLITKLYTIKHRVNQAENSTSSLVYGKQAVKLMQDIYQKIEEKKLNEEAIYFDIGVKGFEDVQIARGDFVVIGGYTSEGKSIWLRHMIYKFLTIYHMNCCYFSFEMSHDKILTLFHILHANNKEKFPETPYISKSKFKKGELTEDELEFFEKAIKDFSTNEEYGSLFLEQPNKSKYNLIDLQMRVKYIESTIMPISVVGVDYLPLMYPLVEGRKSPDMEDYNQMIKDFKNYILTHTNKEGELKPMIGISPTQISRKGKNEALKNDGRYTLDAIRMYNEMETSADIVYTTLLTDAMRLSSQLRIQNLKNRDESVIVDPVEVYCDFDHGYSIGELGARTEEEVGEALQSLNI